MDTYNSIIGHEVKEDKKDKLGVGKNTMVTNKGLRVSPKLSKRMKAVSCSNYLTLEGKKRN